MGTVVILNGYPRCGKDTFAELCQELYPEYVKITSTVIPVKKAAKVLGWDGSKTDSNRSFLHDLKMLWTKYLDGSFRFVNKMAMNNTDKVLFVMAREIPELIRFKKHFAEQNINCVSLLIKREDLHKPDNYADANVEGIEGLDFEYDVIIENVNGDNWLMELEEKAEAFMQNNTDVDDIMAKDCDAPTYEFNSIDEIREFLEELDKDYDKMTFGDKECVKS